MTPYLKANPSFLLLPRQSEDFDGAEGEKKDWLSGMGSFKLRLDFLHRAYVDAALPNGRHQTAEMRGNLPRAPSVSFAQTSRNLPYTSPFLRFYFAIKLYHGNRTGETVLWSNPCEIRVHLIPAHLPKAGQYDHR